MKKVLLFIALVVILASCKKPVIETPKNVINISVKTFKQEGTNYLAFQFDTDKITNTELTIYYSWMTNGRKNTVSGQKFQHTTTLWYNISNQPYTSIDWCRIDSVKSTDKSLTFKY